MVNRLIETSIKIYINTMERVNVFHIERSVVPTIQFAIHVFCHRTTLLYKFRLEMGVKWLRISAIYSISAGWLFQLPCCRGLQPQRTHVLTRSIFKALNCRSIWNWNVSLKWPCFELECENGKRQASHYAAASRVDIFAYIVFTDCVQYLDTRVSESEKALQNTN